VRFIKCDVERHEVDVLAGAKRTLSEDRPHVLVEWSTPRKAYRVRMFQLAKQLGYAIFQFERGRLTPCTTAERRSPPSWELGGNYLLLPCGAPETGANSMDAAPAGRQSDERTAARTLGTSADVGARSLLAGNVTTATV
jgi:hypothetical protein